VVYEVNTAGAFNLTLTAASNFSDKRFNVHFEIVQIWHGSRATYHYCLTIDGTTFAMCKRTFDATEIGLKLQLDLQQWLERSQHRHKRKTSRKLLKKRPGDAGQTTVVERKRQQQQQQQQQQQPSTRPLRVLRDRTWQRVDGVGQTRYTSQWKQLVSWFFRWHGIEYKIKLEHGASGKRSIILNENHVLVTEKLHPLAASAHPLDLDGGLSVCALVNRGPTTTHSNTTSSSSSVVSNKLLFSYELLVMGQPFQTWQQFRLDSEP
jgi:hypothetical protein